MLLLRRVNGSLFSLLERCPVNRSPLNAPLLRQYSSCVTCPEDPSAAAWRSVCLCFLARGRLCSVHPLLPLPDGIAVAWPLHLPAVEFTGFVAHVLKPLLLFVFAAYTSRSASLVNLYGQENYSSQRKKAREKVRGGKKNCRLGKPYKALLALQATERHMWFVPFADKGCKLPD